MNTRLLNLSALTAAVFMVSACSCDRTDTVQSTGEIEVVAPAEGASQSGLDVTYDFGTVFEHQTGSLKIVVRNNGRGLLALSSIEKVEGSPVKIGDAIEDNAVFDIKFQPAELTASEVVEIQADFMPPKADGAVDYKVVLRLHANNTGETPDVATITLVGRGIPGDCELPKTLDFGNIAVDDSSQLSFPISNLTELPVEAIVGDLYSTSGDHAAFGFAPESIRGNTTIESNGTRTVAIDFRPTEQKSYLAFMKAQARATCPEQTITVTGNGVAQVLSWQPAQLDCGYVTPGVQVTRDVTFSNAGSKEINLSQIKTLNVTEFGIVPADPAADPTKLTIPSATKDATGTWTNGSATLSVFCKPAVLGPRQTSLVFQTGLPKQTQGTVTVKVFGGGPDIQVTPSPNLNFGKVAYFSSGTSFQKKKLTVMNVGTAPATPDPKANLRLGVDDGSGTFGLPYVKVTPLNTDTAADEFTVTLPSSYDSNVGLEAKVTKNTADLMVEMRPKSVGQKLAKIEIYSNDPDEPTVEITASADSVVLPPCNYTVTPTTLNFGLIAPPDYRDLAFTIKNNGTNAGDICLLSGLDLAPGSNAFFSLPNGAIDSYEMQPNEVLEVKVRVWPQGTTPTGVSNISGQVDFFLSSDIKPQSAVVLNAQLAPSCLTIAPDELDFGTVQVGCSSQTRTFSIYNTCSTAVTINSFAMQSAAGQPAGGPNCPGTAACPEFFLTQTPAIPTGGLVLTAGAPAQTFQAKYKPIDFGSDTGAVAISAVQNGTNVTYVVALEGVGDSQGKQTDVFTQDAKPKADILLVVDDSCSMSDDQANLAANFGSFIKYANAAQVDYHIAVIKTEANTPDYAKFWFNTTHPEKVLTPTTPNVEQKFKDKVMVGATGGTEWEADPALKALTAPLINSDNAGFLRNDAALAIVAITDEPDQSPQTSSFYLNGFWNIKGFNRKTMFTFNAIAGFSPSCPGDDGTLAFYVSQTNGVKDDLCTPDWSKTLENLGKIAFGFRTNFFMTSVPDLSKGPIVVKIDGTTVPTVDSRGATVWTYDSVGNSVNFEPMYVPEPGQTLTIEYYVTCYP